MDKDSVLIFPDAVSRTAASGIDPNLLLALNNNGGFGGNGNWIWVLFLWLIWGNNGWGNNGFGGNGGTGYLANQLSNDAGRDLLLQAINGRADCLGQLVQMTNTSVESVKNAICTIQSSIQSVGTQVGMTGLETINAMQLGNASLSRQICECCCENRLAIANQTATLQADSARNFAAQQLQIAQNHAEDRLSFSQQTNDLKNQSLENTQAIKDAINAQSMLIADKFCELEKRELQSKITAQGDIITQLRGQIDNDRQTAQLYSVISPIQAKVNEIANKQPNTVPVQWPNLIAANITPQLGQNYYAGGYPYYGGGCYGNNVVF